MKFDLSPRLSFDPRSFRWRTTSSPIGNEILDVVSILRDLWCPWTIDSSPSQSNKFLCAFISEVSHLVRHDFIQVNVFSYPWTIDASTMDECLQEWNLKVKHRSAERRGRRSSRLSLLQEKCYNDIVHVRLSPNSTQMDVYATYAHRPMIRSFDLRSMSFTQEDLLIRDPHPPIDSERSYVMLNFNQSVITAGYQGDYIPTIRGSHGKTLLYALRPSNRDS